MAATQLNRLSSSPTTLRRAGLAAILIAFVALGLAYSIVNPIFEAPDELWHFLNVKYIKDNHALIVQSSDSLHNPARQEGGQPPLYYLISAAVIAPIHLGPSDAIAVLNFDGQPGNVDATLNKNVVIHSADEDFPYHGVSLAVHLLRILSILLAAGTILATYAIAREVFPGSIAIPLGAAAFNAFLPQFVFISSAVNNDNLVNLLASLVILYLVKMAKGDLRNRTFIALGLLMGLVSLSKVSALGLAPLCAGVILWVAIARKTPRIVVKGAVSLLLGFLLIGAWWYLRNWQIYGDPLGIRIFLQAIDRGGATLGAGESAIQAGTLIASFFALFGWSNIVADAFVYWCYGAVFVLGVIGLIRYAVRSLSHASLKDPPLSVPKGSPALLLVPLAWTALITVELVVWAGVVGNDVGRLLFPSISCASLLVATGWAALVGRRLYPLSTALLAIGMCAIVAAAPVVYIRPAYRQGVRFVTSQSTLARPLNVTFGNQIELLGDEISQEVARPGDVVKVTLYWKALPGLDGALYRVLLDLTPEDRSRSLLPINGLLSADDVAARVRQKGWLLRQDYLLKIPANVAGSSQLPIVLGVQRQSSARLNAYDGLMRPIGKSVLVTEIKLAKPR